MALSRQYKAEFETYIWKPYPKWPGGRSKKEDSYKAYLAANKILEFTQSDHEYIRSHIEQRLKDCEKWQKGNRFGPVGCQVFIRGHMWNEPYTKIRGANKAPPRADGLKLSDEENARIFVETLIKRGQEVPKELQHLVPH